jgi:hypothetical protein
MRNLKAPRKELHAGSDRSRVKVLAAAFPKDKSLQKEMLAIERNRKLALKREPEEPNRMGP